MIKEDTIKEWSKKHTSPVTQQVVEAYPNLSNPNARFVIDDIFASGSAAGDLQLMDDNNTAVDGYYFNWAAGGYVRVDKAFLKQLPKNRGLRYTTTGGGNHNVIIKYHLEYDVQ